MVRNWLRQVESTGTPGRFRAFWAPSTIRTDVIRWYSDDPFSRYQPPPPPPPVPIPEDWVDGRPPAGWLPWLPENIELAVRPPSVQAQHIAIGHRSAQTDEP